jgi:hypothetical protein
LEHSQKSFGLNLTFYFNFDPPPPTSPKLCFHSFEKKKTFSEFMLSQTKTNIAPDRSAPIYNESHKKFHLKSVIALFSLSLYLKNKYFLSLFVFMDFYPQA